MMNSFRANPAIAVGKVRDAVGLMARYGKHPYGIGVIGSVALHLVVAIALPVWSGGETKQQTKRPQMVRVVELPNGIQNRLPSNSQALDLSVFDNNPNFNIDLSAINPGQMPYGAMGNIPPGLELLQGGNYLPVPGLPNSGQTNFSFVPNNSPAPITSVYGGFAPPPPRTISGFLPPPPNVPSRFSTTTINPAGFGAVDPNLTSMVSPGGDRQSFSITPQTNPDLIQRQRQLEQEAAIALDNSSFAPNSPDIEFRASQLRPQATNGNPANLLPKPQTQQTSTIAARPSASTARQSLRGNYPKNACGSKASGTATYNVSVASSGVPSQWSLNASSGSNVLDNQASQDIRNARFDGSVSNYVVSVSYSYQPSFCAAFQAPPSTPTNTTPSNTTPPPRQPAATPPAAIETQPKPQPTITIPSEPLKLPSATPSDPPEETP